MELGLDRDGASRDARGMREPAQWIEVDGEVEDVADVPEDPTPTEDVTRGLGAGAELSDADLGRRIAVLLFASPEPLSLARLVALLERPPAARVRAALEALGHALD